jgi:hypothetical protein
MKKTITLLVLLISVVTLFAQSAAKGDVHAATPFVVVRLDGSQNGWPKGDNEAATAPNVIVTGNESVSFSATASGIYIMINEGTNKIKLFALTGQLLFNGELSQGRFFIPTKQGIYFLRINNKSFKVICK